MSRLRLRKLRQPERRSIWVHPTECSALWNNRRKFFYSQQYTDIEHSACEHTNLGKFFQIFMHCIARHSLSTNRLRSPRFPISPCSKNCILIGVRADLLRAAIDLLDPTNYSLRDFNSGIYFDHFRISFCDLLYRDTSMQLLFSCIVTGLCEKNSC